MTTAADYAALSTPDLVTEFDRYRMLDEPRPAALAVEMHVRGLINYKPSFGTWQVLAAGAAAGVRHPR